MQESSQPLTLLVMAAGMGTRYGGLKQVEAVGPGGETLMDYSVFDAMQSGFSRVVFVIRRHFEAAFRETVGRRFEAHLPVEYVFQELSDLPEDFELPPERIKPWGTGHAVLVAEPLIRTPFGVINADDFYGRDSFQALSRFLSQAERAELTDYAMVGFTLRNTLSEHGSVTRAVCGSEDGKFLSEAAELTRIEKRGRDAEFIDSEGRRHPLAGDTLVSMNCWGFTRSIFGHLGRLFHEFLGRHAGHPKEEFYIPSALNELVRSRTVRVRILPTRSAWFGLTYADDLPRVRENIRKLIADGTYPERLWK